MGLIDKFTSSELLEYKDLKRKMLDAYSTNEINLHYQYILELFDRVELRTQIEEAVNKGKKEVINDLLRNGMSIAEVSKYTSISYGIIEKMERNLSSK